MPNGSEPREPHDAVEPIGDQDPSPALLTTGASDPSINQGVSDAEAGRAYYRGRFLRTVAGCNEDILKECPDERFKFSGFGAVILGTACLAAVSMTFGLSIVFEQPVLVVAPGGLLWGAFILALDRWLVSTGTGWRHFLPRVGLAAFFGLIIAEPMVLLAFRDAISEALAKEASSTVAGYEALLVRCNPEVEDPLAPAVTVDGCEDEGRLSLDRPAEPQVPQVTDEQLARQADLGSRLDDLNAQLAEERAALPSEVAGEVGAGLSGRAGDGSAASARREAIDGLVADIDRVGAELDDLTTEIQEIEEQRRAAIHGAEEAADRYNTARSSAIGEQVAQREKQLSATPGLARRMDKLSELMMESHTIFLARVLLTFFFVAIDTAPVFVRILSSGSAYDKILMYRLAGAVEREQVKRRLASERGLAHQRVELSKIKQQAEGVERELALERRLDEARVEEEVENEIARMERAAFVSTTSSYRH